MTPDEEREMLEMAAKAHGFIDDATSNDQSYGLRRDEGGCFYYVSADGHLDWEPHLDDGQAFRLEVKLGFSSTCDTELYISWVTTPSGECIGYTEHSECDLDPYGATRLAVLRAAASIGRNMKD